MANSSLPSVLFVKKGNIRQIAQGTNTAATDSVVCTTANTWYDLSNLSVSITPTSATSKIVIMFTVGFGCATSNTFQIRVVRDGSTAVGVGTGSGTLNVTTAVLAGSATSALQHVSYTVIDSPATTSSVTYSLQLSNGSGSVTALLNRTSASTDTNLFVRGASNIIAFEVIQ